MYLILIIYKCRHARILPSKKKCICVSAKQLKIVKYKLFRLFISFSNKIKLWNNITLVNNIKNIVHWIKKNTFSYLHAVNSIYKIMFNYLMYLQE